MREIEIRTSWFAVAVTVVTLGGAAAGLPRVTLAQEAGKPEPGAPDDGLSDDGAPDDGVSDDGVSHDGAPNDGAPDNAAPDLGAAQAFERPRLAVDSPPEYPAKAFAARLEADVVVLLTVDEAGAVTDVELVRPAGHGFDEEALRAARKLRFVPARIGGVPTPVKIQYTFRFRIPEKDTIAREPPSPTPDCRDACPPDRRAKAVLAMTVFERGKGKPLPGVEVYLLDRDEVYLTDAEGKLELELEPGAYAVTIRPPEFYPFETTERLEPGERLTVQYFIRRHRRARYRTIVWGTEGRAEVARTSLVDDEIRAIPGTLGDPIRVTMLLPGVTGSVSGLGYPIVRGALPGESLYDVDGIPVPMLYHLLFGTAVIHPRFTDEIVFQPGGFSAEQGRFSGGRIAATTTRVPDDPVWAAELSLVQASGFRAQKLGPSSELVAAARYGTLGYLIEGLNSNVVFRYWDYQTRFGHRLADGSLLTLTALGVGDAAGELDRETGREDVLRVGFHRLDLRYRRAGARGFLAGGLQGGYEFFRPPGDGGEDGEEDDAREVADRGAGEWMLRPYLTAGVTLGRGLELRGGGDLLAQDFGVDLAPGADVFLTDPESGLTVGGWAALEAEVGRFLVTPSVRLDHYRYEGAPRSPRATSVDPRLAVAYRLGEDVTLKASGGRFSGPPRFSFVEPPIVFGPVPALSGLGLEHGLQHAWQAQVGAEARLGRDLEGTLTLFFHRSELPIDFSLLGKELAADQWIDPANPCAGVSPGGFVPPLHVKGRSYGAEALVRRRLGEAFFGWLSYAISRSERTVNEIGTIPFDFDQAHVLNAVLSWDVGRNWTLGTVFHFNTGRPYTPTYYTICSNTPEAFYVARRGDANSARLPSYWRIDFRVQKREVFETWYFDFYIDFFNAAFRWETVGYDYDFNRNEYVAEKVPLFLPMVGIRGEF